MIGNYIKAVAAAVSRSTAKLMKTGQTISYQTTDDGDIEAGRNVSFTVLAENNVYGNTNRFTDELGTQTYTKNIVIDWSTYDGTTVLGYRRTTSSGNWSNAINGASLVSIAPFTTGWRLPNIMEMFSILNFQSNNLNYVPFNIAVNNSFWSSTTYSNGTLTAYILDCGNLSALRTSKTLSCFFIPCRTFTVTGTTLS